MAGRDLALALRMAGSILVTETVNEVRLAVAAQSGTERVAFSAVGDTCDLCEALDGKVFRSGSAAARRYSPPVHINCDCLWMAVGDDEVGAVDWFTPADEEAFKPLVEQHGHFVRDPEKFSVLRVPAGPTGRDFTFRRVKDGDRIVSHLEWHRPAYQLDGLTEGTVQHWRKGTGAKWEALDIKALAQATTTAEMEAWARLRWPHMTRIELAGADVENARETLAELDRLGQQYREVEARIPSVRVLPYEEFGAENSPTAFAATAPDGSLKLNGAWYADRQGFDQGWQADVRRGAPDVPPRAGVVAHEFGENWRMWAQAERPQLWAEVAEYTERHHPAEGLGDNATESPNEAFADAFMALHLQPRSEHPAYVTGLRPHLGYEARVSF